MSKVLVTYYSAEGHTRKVAESLSKLINGDLFEIKPIDVYNAKDLDWTDEGSRVTREYHNKDLRNIKLVNNNPANWDSYDTVIIAYPIWWGIAAWPVDTFVKNNKFTGKKVICVATSYSSELGNSVELLKSEAKGGEWLGKRFFQETSDSELKSWIENLNI